jgi:hypothetical protein
VHGALLALLPHLILLYDVARKPPTWRNLDALLLCPGSNLVTMVPTGRRPARSTRPCQTHRSGSLHETRQSPTEIGGVPCAQVNLVCLPVDTELDGLIRHTPGQVILQ